ncbi:MAG: type II toxin-antitoxin system RelE/ParE family toxin [Thermodesulfobacteriota bacterium]
MTYALRFLPPVEEDVFSAYAWYETRAPGLGDELLRMFYACVGAITRNPLVSASVGHEFRRRLLRRFPYAVFFRVQGNEIIVFGFFHSARDPWAIQSNLIQRGDSEIPR